MKISKILYTLLLFSLSCKPDAGTKNDSIARVDSTTSKPERSLFFPVTEYIKGQVYDIKNGGLNPFKVITEHNHTDSGWLKMESIEQEVSDFLSPEIDSVNLTSLFAEKRFMDQTLDAITLTYDPVKPLPDTFSLQHWDVYVDPNTEKVSRVYLVKKLPQKKIQQLTWMSGKKCNIKVISEDTTGKPFIEKEITIKWDPKAE